MPITYHPETDIQEHDRASQTKKVMLYGWDANNLQGIKLAVDTAGAIKVEEWCLMDVETVGAVTYLGQEKEDGSWRINSIDETSGAVSRWAGIANNPTRTTYTTAWTNRATLTYGLRSEAT